MFLRTVRDLHELYLLVMGMWECGNVDVGCIFIAL